MGGAHDVALGLQLAVDVGVVGVEDEVVSGVHGTLVHVLNLIHKF
jgi:hypothetical protein